MLFLLPDSFGSCLELGVTWSGRPSFAHTPGDGPKHSCCVLSSCGSDSSVLVLCRIQAAFSTPMPQLLAAISLSFPADVVVVALVVVLPTALGIPSENFYGTSGMSQHEVLPMVMTRVKN